MTRIVTVIGTDGSGKTTITDLATARLVSEGLTAKRVWLGAESHLMKPARLALRFLWQRRTDRRRWAIDSAKDQSPNGAASYRDEIAQKNGVAHRFRFATRLYVWLAVTDYRLQIALKLSLHRKTDVILADRYVFDVCVNIGLALGWTPDQVVDLARRQLARFPLPQVRVFLRVEPEISMSRKNDIPDLDYLRLRLRYYDEIASAFGFTVLDGTESVAKNCECLLRLISEQYAKPYIHYVHSNNSDVGGADKVLALMVDHSLRPSTREHNGYRVSVSLRESTAVVDEYRRSGVPIILHSFVRPQVSGKLRSISAFVLRSPSGFLYFRRLLARERPDIVHVNDLYDFIPALAAKTMGIPVVFHIRMIKTNNLLRRVFSKLVPMVSNVSVSVSAAVRSHYFPATSSGDHQAEVIHDLGNARLVSVVRSVESPEPRPRPLPEGGRLVVMVGRMEPWKGQHIFVEAVCLLGEETRSSNVFALVGGSVAGKEQYAEAVALDAASAGIHVLGERDDVPDLLRAADISIHCSTSPDPFPGVVIESLLAGAATIAADSGGVPEILNSHDVGILVAAGDPSSLAQQLEALLVDTASPRHRYGSSGRERALALVDEQTIDRQILDLYGHLAAAPRDAISISTIGHLQETTPNAHK